MPSAHFQHPVHYFLFYATRIYTHWNQNIVTIYIRKHKLFKEQQRTALQSSFIKYNYLTARENANQHINLRWKKVEYPHRRHRNTLALHSS